MYLLLESISAQVGTLGFGESAFPRLGCGQGLGGAWCSQILGDFWIFLAFFCLFIYYVVLVQDFSNSSKIFMRISCAMPPDAESSTSAQKQIAKRQRRAFQKHFLGPHLCQLTSLGFVG